MRKLFVILLLFISVTGYSQKQYIPWLQTDDTHVLSNFVLNGDTFRITGPANGQIIQRVSGKWINVPSPASVFDSLVWNPGTGDLVSWKDGSPFNTENLDGRYAVNDGNIGDMLKAIYDTAMISEQLVGLTASQTLSNKILILPTIANFTNAQHNHSSAATGGLINSDNIAQGTVNFFSRWGKNANTIYYNTGSVAIGKTTAGSALDVVGTTTTQGLAVTSTITFDGLTITDIQPGSTDNNHLVTKGYVDEQIISAGGYTDEQAQDAVGTILDDGTLGDVVFNYDDPTPKISATVKDDSHAHTGTTISGLTTSNFTSPNVSQWNNDANYLTGTTGNLTENITGMEFSATRQVIGGAAQLSLSTGYVIPTTTEQSNWTAGYNDKINSAVFSGTTTKTLTLTQQDAGTVTANFSDLNTTYAVSAETATGGANLRLTGSDSSTDDVKLAGAGSVTVSRPDANTISISGTDNQSLSFNSGTGELSISGGNAVTIPLSAGGDNWGSQVVISDTTLLGNGTSLSPLAVDTTKIATKHDLTQLPTNDTNTTYSISSEIVSGGANLRLSGSDNTIDDVKLLGDGDITVTRTDASTITIGASFVDSDGQTLSTTGDPGNVSISSGNSIDINVNDADSSPTNEIQHVDTFRIVNNILELSLSQDGQSKKTVDLSNYDNNTDNQTLSLINDTLSISNGNSVNLSEYRDNTDNQNLGLGTRTGTLQPITISGGTGAIIDVADNDDSPTNEAQILSLGGIDPTISLSSVSGAGGGDIVFKATGSTTVSKDGDTLTINSISGTVVNAFTATIPVNSSTMSVSFPTPFASSNYYLDFNVFYNQTIDGKDVRVENAIYDYSKTASGFTFKVDTVAGYIELFASDTVNVYPFEYSEADPTVPPHVKEITETNISNWGTAYGWGNHASAGYITGNQTVTLSGAVTGSGSTSISTTLANNAVTYAKLGTDMTASNTVSSTVDMSAGGIGKITLSANTAFTFTNFQLNKTYMLIVTANGYTASFAQSSKHIAVEGNATIGTTGVYYISLTCIDTSSGSEKLLTVIMKGA